MFSANLIMYSRTLTEDYRWLYSDPFIDPIIEKNILDHYESFKENKNFYINQHLVIRTYDHCVIAYRFLQTDNTDQNSRKIYALIGFVFSDIDLMILKNIYPYVFSHLFFELDFLKKYTTNISDKLFKVQKSIEFDLNVIFDEYKNNECAKYMADPLASVWSNHLKDHIIITSKSIFSLQLKPLLTLNLPVTETNEIVEDKPEAHPVCENEYPKENAVLLNQSNEENDSTDAREVSVNPSMMTVSDIENITLDISNSDKKPVIIEKKNNHLIIRF